MNYFKAVEDFGGLESDWFRFPGFEVSWAGENPRNGGLILGSDDGRLLTTGPDGRDGGSPFPVSDSGEAVNGVAFTKEAMAVSTRSDVTFVDLGPGRKEPGTRTFYCGGAHGVVSTSTGCFVAPLGPEGLLLVKPEAGPPQLMRISTPKNNGVNLYKIARLYGDGHEDLFACAARRGGLLAVTVRREGPNPAQSFKAPNLDVVGVCALGSSRWPRAAVGLGADHSLHLCRDLMDGTPPKTLHFNAMSGTAYSILHSDGHIFLLTSRGLYSMPRLATRFLDGEDIGGRTLGKFLPLRAVDAYLAYEKLLVVLADRVVAVEIDSLIARDESTGGMDSSSWETSPILDIPWESAPSQDWNLVPTHSL